MHLDTHTHTNAQKHKNTNTHALGYIWFVCIIAHTNAFACICEHVRALKCIWKHWCVWTHSNSFLWAFVCICMHLCMHLNACECILGAFECIWTYSNTFFGRIRMHLIGMQMNAFKCIWTHSHAYLCAFVCICMHLSAFDRMWMHFGCFWTILCIQLHSRAFASIVPNHWTQPDSMH